MSTQQRKALALLASFPLAHGFDRAMIAGLVNERLATARREVVTAPHHTTVEVVRVKITDAGRKAIED